MIVDYCYFFCQFPLILLAMYISIMISNECALTFAGGVVYFNKSMNHSMYVVVALQNTLLPHHQRTVGQKQKNTLVSGNAGDKKNLHTGARRFFFINFPKILSFLQFLLFFCILVFFSFFFFVFACVIFKIKNKYSDTHSIMRWVSNKKKFTRPIFGNKTTFFWPYEIRRKEGDTEFDDFII